MRRKREGHNEAWYISGAGSSIKTQKFSKYINSSKKQNKTNQMVVDQNCIFLKTSRRRGEDRGPPAGSVHIQCLENALLNEIVSI